MILDSLQAIVYKAYYDIKLKGTDIELHFISPTRAIFRKRVKPQSHEPPQPQEKPQGDQTQ